jgi:membrane protein implicated in regulation of membrane protease activity
MGRIIGIVLIVAGLLICGVVALFMGVGALAAGEGPGVSRAGAILGIALFGVAPLLILGGVGVFMFIKGGQEATEMADVRKKERLLGMIQAAGKVSLASAAIELKMTRDQVKNAILDLVNQGLFSGYTNWQEQMFYSKDLSQMQTTKCPNCGGQREAVGKGLVKCPYCGVELFLPQS